MIRYSGSVLNIEHPEDDLAKAFVVDQQRSFRLGVGAVMPCLEVATYSMLEGETCEVHCIDILGYGWIPLLAKPTTTNQKTTSPPSSNDSSKSTDSSNSTSSSSSNHETVLVPGHSALKLTLTLVKRESNSQAIGSYTTTEILAEMIKIKSYGNAFFSEGQYYRAGTMYSKGINLLQFVKEPSQAQAREFAQLMVSYGNNMANTLMKMGTF